MSGPGMLERKVLRDLWHLRGQVLAVAVVMACGIAMFVSLRSMHGWLRDTQRRYYAEYRFADIFASVRRAPDAVATVLARTPGVAAVATRVVRDVTVDLPALPEPGTLRLVSVPEHGRPVLNALHLRQGRWLEPGHPDEILLSEAFARANGLAPGDTLGAVIAGRWQRLRIAGLALSPEFVYEIRGMGDIFPDNRRFGVAWIARPALAAAFDMRGAFNDVTLALVPGASEAAVIDAADRLLAPWGGTGAYGRADHVSDQFLTGEIDETQVTSVLIPVIFLGVTAFLLHMVLARLVATQRDQVAILKAFGYRNGRIGLHYLELALVPVLAGAIAGTGLGVWLAAALARVYARFYQFPDAGYHQDWGVALIALAIAGGAALVGALTSVARAVRLPPAEAMRPEAPGTFRPGILKRLGLHRLVPPAVRIVLRGVERRPARTALSVVGIALATAIVMTGWFMFDAIGMIREIQFELVQRQDVTVTFDAPIDARARWALARLPGVHAVEPFRAVPVRLRHGPWQVRTALLGVEPGARMHRLVDRDLTVREVPRGGMLLSGVLASDLRVRAGDTVIVEVLEGRRPVRPVVVAGTVDDLLGSSATMSREGVARLLGEGGMLSGAWLGVEPTAVTALYRTLQETPAVSGVVDRAAVIEGFDRTIAESFWISITTMVAFACIIAAGVLYNGARVALSERGRELASLRVLGFSRAEVTRLLLGEQALLTVLGVPLGLLLGWGLAWLIAFRFDSDLFRIPLVIHRTTIAASLVVVLGTAALTGLAIRHRIHRLDLIAVLKTRE